MITDVPGIQLGHATDKIHHTGCTVVLCPEGTVGGVDVRGPSPGSRETALLDPDKHVDDVTAVLLTGGSAFGLAAADGVVRYLEEHELGHWTPLATVPIVPAAVVYDLFFSEGKRRPDAEMGYLACQAAQGGEIQQGNVGAGTGVTVGKWAGFEGIMKGGFGTAAEQLELESGETLAVGAAAVTNCVGDVLNANGTILAGARDPDGTWFAGNEPLKRMAVEPEIPDGTNTTLIVAATNADLNKVEVNRLARHAQNGLVMAIRPAHTTHDGDTAFALATGRVEARIDLVSHLVELVTAEAIRNSVRHASSLKGIPGLAGE